MNRPAVVFDLDDTLYLERDFAHSGFRAAGAFYERTTGRAGLGNRCVELFEAGLRGHVFDAALADVAPESASSWTPRLVEVYRRHAPSIELASDAARWLSRADARARFGVITDGPVATQRSKIEALGLSGAFGFVVFTDAWGQAFRKPHPRAFVAMEARAATPADRLVYVADNPLKDFLAPKARGWRTLRIARPERIHRTPAPGPRHEADGVIASLDELDLWLDRFGLAQGLGIVPA